MLMLAGATWRPGSGTIQGVAVQFTSTDSVQVNMLGSLVKILTGHFDYENKQENKFLVLAFAKVSIYDSSHQLLGAGYTDINGNFSFGPVDIPSNGMYLACEASTDSPNVTVFDGDTNSTWISPEIFVFINSGQDSFLCEFPDTYNERTLTVFSYQTGLNKGWHYVFNTTGQGDNGRKGPLPFKLWSRLQ
jgi:hypothetical protein